MKITRVWAMPNKNTTSISAIRKWMDPYLARAIKIVDPFARDCTIAHLTNDLNPNTKAQYNLLASDFLQLKQLKQVKGADLVIFDPPFTLGQVKQCYEGVGKEFFQKDAQNATRWTIERDIIASIQKLGYKVISFGYTSTCMGKKRGYTIEEILLVSHGPAHNDTLCVVEKKTIQL